MHLRRRKGAAAAEATCQRIVLTQMPREPVPWGIRPWSRRGRREERRHVALKTPPRHIVVDGQPMVVLSRKDFENLAALRRSIGGQGARVRSLRDALLSTSDFLEELGAALGTQKGASEETPGAERAADLLASVPERVSAARRAAGCKPEDRG